MVEGIFKISRPPVMRVLHFYKTALPDTVGGIEQAINQIARATKSLGIQTDVLSLAPAHLPRTTEHDGYRVHRARLDFQLASTGFSASAFLRFAQLAKNADLIHYHFPWPFMDVVHFATRVNKPTILTYHSDIIRQRHLLKVYWPLRERFLRSVDRIVATSQNYLTTSDVLQRFLPKVSVIPIGLSRETYPTAPKDRVDYWRDRVGSKFFLFVGMLRYYKGLHILLEAARGTDYPIVIVGAGPIERELREQAVRLGLRNIHFLGYLPGEDKAALLELCYSVVFPSHLRSEAFGISLLEGAMYGKPLISSEIGTGTTFINVGGETGLVVPPGNANALRQAMDILWQDSPRAEAMGANAARRYQNYFTATQMAESYAQLYFELVDRRRALDSSRFSARGLPAP